MLGNVIGSESNGIKVLHVDDDESQSEFLRFFLPANDDSLQIDCVNDPDKVLDYLKEGDYDCVVTDFQMPVINGIELADLIRSEYDIPIIIYTGQGSEEVAESAFSVGIDDYMRKEMDPSHYQVLARRIRNVVEKKRIDSLYRTVIEQTRDALMIFVDSAVVYANQALLDLLGIKDVSEFGDNPFHFFVGEDRSKAKERLQHVLTHGHTPGFFEYKLKRKDGKHIYVDVSTSPISYHGKKGIICFARDVTEKHRLEEEKKETQIRLQSLVTLAPDGIITVDLGGNITSVNPAFGKLTGFKDDEILGKNLLKLPTLREMDFKKNLKLFGYVLRGRLPPPFQLIYKRKDGTSGWAEAHACFIDIQGKKEILAIIREITERKEMEKERQENSMHMETPLNQYKNMYSENEKHISEEIIYQLCNELNSPLNDLSGLIDALKDDPGTINKMLPVLKDQVEFSLERVQEVSKRVSDTPLVLEYVEIDSLIHTTLRECNIPDSIKVKVNHEIFVNVFLDPKKMKKVLTKLINNAVEAMPKGGKLEISTELIEDDFLLVVRDTGLGIKPSIMNNIFKPFYSTKEGGVGLGLVYCKKTIEEHEGQISVESKPGVGTSVYIKMPMLTPKNDLDYSYLKAKV
ncbi:PAS domain S-box protein [Candidatus Bathyarchaeota archaeon]|nr:PAS domain S-box protein [Candidatus Bathyarchaeota archaeon]